MEPNSRRAFLARVTVGGVSLLGLSALSACTDANITGFSTDFALDFSSDAGVLDYLYLLEQVQADFQVMAAASPAADLTSADRATFAEVRDHHLVRRDTLAALLGGASIGTVKVQYSPATFASRSALLVAAASLADLTTEAYLGAAVRIVDAATVALVARMASVQARHAAVLNDMRSPGTGAFASDAIITDGLEQARDVRDVLGALAPHLVSAIEVRNLA